jgi:uncharacterized membrane protein
VSSTILMAIVLVVMWLVVLVPMFVRRGDEHEEEAAEPSPTRVLSRRAPAGVAGHRPYATATPEPYAEGASPVRTAARTRMLRRRRRTLAVLTATVLVGVPGAVLVDPILWLASAPAVLLLGGYVGWLRKQVRREHDRRDRRKALFADTDRPAAAEHPVRRTRAVVPTIEDAAATPDRSWRPVPVPTPTYVTAPVVRRRSEHTVDLDDDDPTFIDLDDDLADRPRAVNE